MPSLESVPREVLEHIALFAATHRLVGPPSDLAPLLATCRPIHALLSLDASPHLYARVFSSKFDTRSAFRRLGAHVNTPRVLADELKKRCTLLTRIRTRTGCHAHPSSPTLIDSLWLAYLMMIENDGRNERQLLDYAQMDGWLLEYWFDDRGASSAARMIAQHAWPPGDDKNAIAMWLLWLLLPGPITRHTARYPRMTTIIKLTALAANHYPVCHPTWTQFRPRSEAELPPGAMTHFSDRYRLRPPTLAPAAILVFATLTWRARGQPLQTPASAPLDARRSEDWDAAWRRCLDLGQSEHPGTVEGVWEGIFTYTDFSTYSMLLSSEPPSAIEDSLVAHNWQTWKLREFHLEAHASEACRPVGSGDPLNAYFPAGTRFVEHPDSVEIHEPGRDAVHYWRTSHATSGSDVVLVGEGHSAWGQFNVYGRVRPLDGFISLYKEYVGDHRGTWLYRGYLVGNAHGHISGRWRDTLTPLEHPGYEGCFVMSRRR